MTKSNKKFKSQKLFSETDKKNVHFRKKILRFEKKFRKTACDHNGLISKK